MRHLYRGELAEPARWVWLLEVVWAGRTWRWATAPAHIVAEDGVTRQYSGGLDLARVDRASALGGAVAQSVSVSVPWEYPTSVAELVEQGHDLSDATGEVSAWVVGGTYEDRHVVVSGAVSIPTYDGEGEPVSLTVVSRPWRDGATLPPEGWVITSATWSEATEAAGQVYPLVYGRPGYLDGTTAVPATPAYPVEYTAGAVDTLLVAGGQVGALTVTVYADGVSLGALAVTARGDGTDQLVSVVDISGQSATARTADEYYVGWSGGVGAVGGAGLVEPAGLGSILVWLLRQSGAAVDLGAWESARVELDRVQIGGYVELPTVAVDLAIELIAMYPLVDVVTTGRGVAPVLWRPLATTADAVAALDLDAGEADRIGGVTYAVRPEDRVGAVLVEYGQDEVKARPRGILRLVHPAGSLAPTSTHGLPSSAPGRDYQTARTEERPCPYLHPRGRTVTPSGRLLWDEDSAYRVAEAWALRWRQHRTVRVEVHPEWGWLDRGDVVTVTDSSIGWADRVCQVAGITLADAGWLTLDLVMWG